MTSLCFFFLGLEVNPRYTSSLSRSPADNNRFRKGFVGCISHAPSWCDNQGMCVPLDTGSLEEGRWKIILGFSWKETNKIPPENKQSILHIFICYSEFLTNLSSIQAVKTKITEKYQKFIVYKHWTSPRICIFLYFINFLFLTDSRARTPVSIQSRPRHLPLPAEIHGAAIPTRR